MSSQFPHYSVQIVDKDGRMTREGLRFFQSMWERIPGDLLDVVFQDAQTPPHYWRLTVDNTGALVTTDLGTTAP